MMLPTRHVRELFVSIVVASTRNRTARGEVDARSGFITFYCGGKLPPRPPQPIGGPRRGLGRTEAQGRTPESSRRRIAPQRCGQGGG